MKKECLIIGAGRSGRGYLGELLFLEDWHITFADINAQLTEALKKARTYHVFKYGEDGQETITPVTNFDVVNTVSDHAEYIQRIADASLVMTALFPDAFQQVAADLVEAMRLRKQRQEKHYFVILLGANYVGLKETYTKLIQEQLNTEELDYFKTYGRLVETVITRINSIPTPQQADFDPLSIQGEDQPILAVNAELTDYIDIKQLPKFFVYEKDTQRHFKTKIWQGNTMHCTLAFMGKYHGYTYLYEAARNKHIRACAEKAYREGNAGLVELYGEEVRITESKLQGFLEEYADDAVKDWIIRVGGDPIRKLSKNDRFIGPALLCVQHGIVPYFICQAAAYGFLFKEERLGEDRDITRRVDQIGIEAAIQQICGLDLHRPDEKLVYDLIFKAYQNIVSQ